MPHNSSEERFVAAIDCMDGRSGYAVRRYVEGRFGFHFIDRCTEPGMDEFSCQATEEQWEHMRYKVVDISVGMHGSRKVLVVGHEECAGNPVSKEEHIECVERAMERIAKWDFGVSEPVHLIGLYVYKGDGDWTDWRAELVEETMLGDVPEKQSASA